MTATLFVPTLAEFQLTAARRRLGGAYPICQQFQQFQLTAARRRLGLQAVTLPRMTGFQLTAARRRLAEAKSRQGSNSNCFNSQPPEGGWKTGEILETDLIVSTHSRPKAAGSRRWRSQAAVCCFNSQPPEGGWFHVRPPHPRQTGFNSQPPEGGWARAFR